MGDGTGKAGMVGLGQISVARVTQQPEHFGDADRRDVRAACRKALIEQLPADQRTHVLARFSQEVAQAVLGLVVQPHGERHRPQGSTPTDTCGACGQGPEAHQP